MLLSICKVYLCSKNVRLIYDCIHVISIRYNEITRKCVCVILGYHEWWVSRGVEIWTVIAAIKLRLFFTSTSLGCMLSTWSWSSWWSSNPCLESSDHLQWFPSLLLRGNLWVLIDSITVLGLPPLCNTMPHICNHFNQFTQILHGSPSDTYHSWSTGHLAGNEWETLCLATVMEFHSFIWEYLVVSEITRDSLIVISNVPVKLPPSVIF